MVAEIGVIQALSKLLQLILDKGSEKLVRDRRFNDGAELVREALARELRLASALLDDLEEVCDQPEAERFYLKCIEIDAYESVGQSGVPLSRIIDVNLDDVFWAAFSLTAKENNYVLNIRSACVLIERTYLRLKMLKIRTGAGSDRTDREYLKKLLRASIRVLDMNQK